MNNYLLKSDAAITYMTISNMINFLTIGNASITYQTINNMSNYATNSKVKQYIPIY